MELLVVPGSLDSLGAIRDYVRQAAVAAGLEKSAAYRLTLAVDEIASNVVMHGYTEAGLSGNIEVSAVIRGDALQVELEDSGATYDVSQYKEPENLHRPVAERTEGGFGVFLAMQGVDRFSYAREAGRNRHTFIVNLAHSLTGSTGSKR